MTTLIPNENCWIGFSEDMPAATDLVPTAAEVAAADRADRLHHLA